VKRQLLRLLSINILVYSRVLANYNIKFSKILPHWFLSMDAFRFCETYLLHIKLFVGDQSAISPFLGGILVLRDMSSHYVTLCDRISVDLQISRNTSHSWVSHVIPRMYEWVMSRVAVCCSVSQCAAVCCSVSQCVAVSCNALQCVAVCCSVLQCVLNCVLQCIVYIINLKEPRSFEPFCQHRSIFWLFCTSRKTLLSHLCHRWMRRRRRRKKKKRRQRKEGEGSACFSVALRVYRTNKSVVNRKGDLQKQKESRIKEE